MRRHPLHIPACSSLSMGMLHAKVISEGLLDTFFFFSTNVRKEEIGYKFFSIPVVFHKIAGHGPNHQAPRTPEVFQGSLITAHVGGEACEHLHQEDWLHAWDQGIAL